MTAHEYHLRRNMPRTHRVISDLKLLHWHAALLRHIAQKEGRLRVGGVSLIGIGLDDDSAVDAWCVIRLVSLRVVRVDLT